MLKRESITLFLKGILNSYSQVFFSDNRVFSLLLLVVTFIDFYAGLFGFISVLITTCAGFLLGFDKRIISRGLYGFNSLLVGLGLGIYYEPDLFLLIMVILASLLTLLIAVSLQGVIGKYALPYLSVPFLFGIWAFTLATSEFTALGISERGIYTFNDLYIIGGDFLVRIYEWWNDIALARSIRIYFLSLGAILFQYNMLSGILIALGLLYFSRISFTLSLLGFYTAYLFYEWIGADISELSYTYIGFNYILTSIALGGFFIIPSIRSYLWVAVLIPLVAIITISLSSVFSVFKLPIYSLPFNMVVLLFLYALKFRIIDSDKLSEVFIQQNSPEKNLYSFHNDRIRFRHDMIPIKLPFFGTWSISQAHEGEHTHKDEWKHAWDFIITGQDNKQFKGSGDELTDYLCYDKAVLSPADGFVELVVDDIPDNKVGDVNINENWGNTIIIKHSDSLFSSLSHLKPGSIQVNKGDQVKEGDRIGRCGNSGRSPYPHLHFQLQATPYIGSPTLYYPLSYYITRENGTFKLHHFEVPHKDQKVSDIEITDLLKQGMNFIPGKKISFEVQSDNRKYSTEWNIQTDPYNNPFIQCLDSGAKAYFTNDGNLFYIKHYQGKRKTLLYYFTLAAFKIQQGFYQDLILEDKYPLNLIFQQPVLGVQDFLAPFYMFLNSRYSVKYENIDNEISPTSILLKASAKNTALGKVTRQYDFSIEFNNSGIAMFKITGKNISIVAKCIE